MRSARALPAIILLSLFAPPPACPGAAPPAPLRLTLAVMRYAPAKRSPDNRDRRKPPAGQLVEIRPESGIIRVRAGEPLILRYRLMNTSGQELTINVGDAPQTWLRVSVVKAAERNGAGNAGGRSEAGEEKADGRAPGRPTLITLTAGSGYGGQCVPDKRIAPRSAGRYRLLVRMTLPCYDGRIDAYAFQPELTPPNRIVDETRTLNLEVVRSGG